MGGPEPKDIEIKENKRKPFHSHQSMKDRTVQRSLFTSTRKMQDPMMVCQHPQIASNQNHAEPCLVVIQLAKKACHGQWNRRLR
jgi:hypothetical protein